MLGTFQKTQLRIEIEASATALADSLLRPDKIMQWVPLTRFSSAMPEQLYSGFDYLSWNGPIQIHHHVDVVGSDRLRLLLSKGIDGFYEWYWGEGWVQSRLEGISVLPLSLAQTVNLLCLRQFLTK